MRLLALSLLLVASLSLCGCVNSLHSQQSPAKWTIGFWYWGSRYSDAVPNDEVLDVLFFHAGTIQKQTRQYLNNASWSVYGELPDHLPAAREYWLVFRFERQQVPDLLAAPVVAQEVSRLMETCRRRQLPVAGIQLDIDSPTGSLSQYAEFLREVRKGLRPGVQISVTALLDWFQDNTSVARVIKEVDEFVPQFYDVGTLGSGSAIAARFDAVKWGPVFNRFGKRFRIGISTFGRARLAPRQTSSQSGYSRVSLYREVTPLDIAVNSAFNLETRRNEAGEIVLNYRAMRKALAGNNEFAPGDIIQFILSTPDAVRAAVKSARRMRGYCAGVVFFRWPASDESLVMQPNEVLEAAGIANQEQRRPAGVQTVDGGCAAVKCVDVYLVNTQPLFPKSIRYRIHSSVELEYFLPEGNMPVRMSGPSELELLLPPYCGRGRLYLGRAVCSTQTEFTVESEP